MQNFKWLGITEAELDTLEQVSFADGRSPSEQLGNPEERNRSWIDHDLSPEMDLSNVYGGAA